MKCIIYKNPTLHSHEVDIAVSFMTWQNINVEIREDLGRICRISKGRSIVFAAEFYGQEFYDCMSLIDYFRKQGLCLC